MSRFQTARFSLVKSAGGGSYLRMTISSGFAPQSHSVQSPTNAASESAQHTHSVSIASAIIKSGFWHVTHWRDSGRSLMVTPPSASTRRFISSLHPIAPTRTGCFMPFILMLATSRKVPQAKFASPAVTTVVLTSISFSFPESGAAA